MKKISSMLITGLIILSCNQKTETAKTNTDWNNDNLKGEVQSIAETPFKVDSTGTIGAADSCCIEFIEYDNTGKIKKFTRKDSKGNISNEQSYTKYDDGLFKEMVTTEKGKVVSRISIKAENGKYTGAEEFDSTGKLSAFYTDIKTNEYQQVTSMNRHNVDSSLKGSFVTTYDKNIFMGQVSKDSTGKETSRSTAKVDDKGNQIEFNFITTMVNDKTKKDSTTNKVTHYKYDSFDEQGNWTKRTELDEKDKAVKVVKREIFYYKK